MACPNPTAQAAAIKPSWHRAVDLGKSRVALWTPAQLRYAKFQTRGYSDTREARLYSAASLAPLLFLGFPAAFFSTGAKNFPV